LNFNNITLKIQIFFHCSPWENLLMYPDNLLTDQILYSPNLDACRCIGILRRSYILIPYENIRMQNLLHVSCICVIQNLLRVCTHLLSSRDEGKANRYPEHCGSVYVLNSASGIGGLWCWRIRTWIMDDSLEYIPNALPSWLGFK